MAQPMSTASVRSPLHVFAEQFLERHRLTLPHAAAVAAAANSAVNSSEGQNEAISSSSAAAVHSLLTSGGMGFNPYDPSSTAGSSRVNQVGQMGDRVVAAYHGVTSRIGSGNNNDLEVAAGLEDQVGDSTAGAAISALGEPSGLAGRIGSDLHPPKKKRYYNLPFMMGKVSLKIGFDRLALHALLDRSATFLENSASVILSVGVAAMTGLLLNQNHYQDLSTFLVCGVAAGCQYSLLKSVQPDSASPTHGFNRITVFSRAVYFVLCRSGH